MFGWRREDLAANGWTAPKRHYRLTSRCRLCSSVNQALTITAEIRVGIPERFHEGFSLRDSRYL